MFYPLKSAKLFNSDYSRIIYITEVLIVFLIGIIPSVILAAVGSSYTVIGFPPLYCAINSTFRFYVTVIPILTTNSSGLILMLLVIYRLHMVSLMVYVCDDYHDSMTISSYS